MTTTVTQQAFQLRGSLFTLTVLQLANADVAAFNAHLEDVVNKAPKFFQHAPVVLDLQLLSAAGTEIDFQGIFHCLREYHLVPVGVRGGTHAQHQAAIQAGLAVLSVSKNETPTITPTRAEPSPQAKAKTEPPPTQSASLLITHPVRSGQQVYAQDRDLIVVASVSEGAELLADGNIHVYGPIRGRALAGVNGNTDARIFCQGMVAELVSIAGQYIVSESLTQTNSKQVMQVFLDDGKLQITPV